MILNGDFNVWFHENGADKREVGNFFASSNVFETVFELTRKNSQLDNVFTNIKNNFISHCENFPFSDHKMIITNFSLKQNVDNEFTFTRLYSPRNIAHFLSSLDEVDWGYIQNHPKKSVNEKTRWLMTELTNKVDLCFPYVKKK